MPSRRTLLGSIAAGAAGGFAGCSSSRTTPTPDATDPEAFAAADRATETSVHVESRPPGDGPLLTERGIGTPLGGDDPDDHWTVLETDAHVAALRGDRVSDQARALLDTVDLDRAFVFVYQVHNRVPHSVTEVPAVGVDRDRLYFHLAWDDGVQRLPGPTVKTWFVVVPGAVPSRPAIKVTYTLGREW